MRISKVTGLSHYKKVECGYLASDKKETIIDDISNDIMKKIHKLNFQKSMQDKIIKKRI